MTPIDMTPADMTSAGIAAATDAEAAGHAEIHAGTLTLDTHVDIPWPNTPDPRGETQRNVDFARMKAGGLKAVVFIAYTPQGPRTPEDHAEAGARAEAMLRAIRDTAHGAGRRIVTRVAELEAAHAAGATAVLLAVENGNAMGHDLSRLALWRGLGAIYLTLTHDGHNDLADAARPRHGRPEPAVLHGGLSALGRQAVEEMNRLGMLVDVSHASKASMMQAVECSRAPIVATHACCAALRAHPRNLDDAQLDALRDSGGLVQITAVPAFLRDPGPDGRFVASVEDIADHVDHAVRRIGLDHVGLSSDFDGGGGVRGWMHAGETGGLTEALHRRGYDRQAIGALWAGNFLRVWRRAEEVAAEGF